jgi:hypothetical protein
LNTNKSTGVDKVHPKVLKECSNSIAKPLSILFNRSYSGGIVPKLWLHANVTPLFKKGDKLNPSNYRPISLTSIVCKIMESLIRDSMMKHLIDNNLIIKEQHGFVPKKSCCTNLLETMDLLTQAIEEGYPIDILFLDFAKAFDTVAHTRLGLKLSMFGFADTLLSWIKAFLGDRYQRVILGDNISEWIRVLSGVPQGSVLGPLLFIIFINDLIQGLPASCKCKLYADDTKMVSVIKHSDDCEKLKQALDKLVEWSKKWLLSFNNDKCKVMHVGSNNKENEYVMDSKLLSKSDLEKDLGVFVSKDLK